jgi:hypothetical protein
VALSFEETLVEVWRQTLVENAKTIELGIFTKPKPAKSRRSYNTASGRQNYAAILGARGSSDFALNSCVVIFDPEYETSLPFREKEKPAYLHSHRVIGILQNR